jgi:hypothetical protein
VLGFLCHRRLSSVLSFRRRLVLPDFCRLRPDSRVCSLSRRLSAAPVTTSPRTRAERHLTSGPSRVLKASCSVCLPGARGVSAQSLRDQVLGGGDSVQLKSPPLSVKPAPSTTIFFVSAESGGRVSVAAVPFLCRCTTEGTSRPAPAAQPGISVSSILCGWWIISSVLIRGVCCCCGRIVAGEARLCSRVTGSKDSMIRGLNCFSTVVFRTRPPGVR